MTYPKLFPTKALAILFIAAFAAILGLSPAAKAHEFEPERQVLMQVFPEHVDIVITYIEAPGERTGLFGAQFGLTKKGAPEPLTELAKRAMLPRMLDGLTFEIQGETPIAGEPQMRLERKQGRIMAAAFVRYEVSALEKNEERQVFIRSRDRSFLPTDVQIYSGEGLKRIDGQDEFLMTVLDRGQELSATFTVAADED